MLQTQIPEFKKYLEQIKSLMWIAPEGLQYLQKWHSCLFDEDPHAAGFTKARAEYILEEGNKNIVPGDKSVLNPH